MSLLCTLIITLYPGIYILAVFRYWKKLKNREELRVGGKEKGEENRKKGKKRREKGNKRGIKGQKRENILILFPCLI